MQEPRTSGALGGTPEGGGAGWGRGLGMGGGYPGLGLSAAYQGRRDAGYVGSGEEEGV